MCPVIFNCGHYPLTLTSIKVLLNRYKIKPYFLRMKIIMRAKVVINLGYRFYSISEDLIMLINAISLSLSFSCVTIYSLGRIVLYASDQ